MSKDIADGMMDRHWSTPERNALINRVRHLKSGTIEDWLQYARLELWDAIGCSEPMTRTNGRTTDSFHAGCCCSRSEMGISQALKKAAKLERVAAAASKMLIWIDDPDAIYTDKEADRDHDEFRAALADLDEESE